MHVSVKEPTSTIITDRELFRNLLDANLSSTLSLKTPEGVDEAIEHLNQSIHEKTTIGFLQGSIY